MLTTGPTARMRALASEEQGLRAAAYVRRSTDLQEFSIENQMQVISQYARSNGIEIIRTYADEGSGLTLQGRSGLQQLIFDVLGGATNLDLILVYDVSRWGRFQDVDESAHYEFICRKAGVLVEYCADGFKNNGTMVATFIKGLKRAMAAEYSRELSEKVSHAKLRLARLGLHLGGRPCFGFRRMLVDRHGRRKCILQDGERKNIQDDRVILVPGPADEVQTVREIFQMFVEDKLSQKSIARILNRKGIRNGRGNRWTQQTVKHFLRSERYIGNVLYGRTSVRLRGKPVSVPPHDWVRATGAIAAIIEPAVFEAAQMRLRLGRGYSAGDLLNHLTAVWCVTGYLSVAGMKRVKLTPVPNTYTERFGSLANAFRLVGYKRSHSYRYDGCSDLLRALDRDLISRLTSTISQHGGCLQLDPERAVLTVNETTTITTAVIPYMDRPGRRSGWWFHFNHFPNTDLILMARMTTTNTELLDHHLLPPPLRKGPTFRFTAKNIADQSKHRLTSLAEFYDAYRRWLEQTKDYRAL